MSERDPTRYYKLQRAAREQVENRAASTRKGRKRRLETGKGNVSVELGCGVENEMHSRTVEHYGRLYTFFKSVMYISFEPLRWSMFYQPENKAQQPERRKWRLLCSSVDLQYHHQICTIQISC
jgi:hypothetical protein